MSVDHWTEFLAFALCHAEAMKHVQISVDPMQIAAAMQAAQQQARQYSNLMTGGGFDTRLIKPH